MTAQLLTRSPFQLSLPGFEGSLEGLVQLVDQHEFGVHSVLLSSVTDQFSRYVEKQGEVDLQAIGDFLRLSSRLMVLKSNSLLPLFSPLDHDEDTEAPDNETHDFWPELPEVAAFLGARQYAESIPPAPRTQAVERDIQPAPADLLRRAWVEMNRRKETVVTRITTPPFVRLEVALSSLIRRLRSGVCYSFKHLVGESNRNDAVIHFLALLELLRRRNVVVDQPTPFGDIAIEWVEHDQQASARAG